MKLPEAIGEVVDWDSTGSPYVHWNTKPGSITNLYSEAQVKELLAESSMDASDLMLIVHMKQAAKYDPVLKMALEALEATAADVKLTPNAYEAQRRAIHAIREVLGG